MTKQNQNKALNGIKNKDEIIEQLAAIEHQRWSDWQKWVHIVFNEGKFNEFMPRWEKQINTEYRQLTREDQLKDIEQVKRYWPIIESLFGN